MPTRDLSALFGGTLDYPGVPSTEFPKGKTYKVPSPDAVTGARLTWQASIGQKLARGKDISPEERAAVTLSDTEEEDFYKDILGPVYDEMLADGVPWTVLMGVAEDAYLVITGNEGLADFMLGEAVARPNRAARRAATPKKTAGSKSSPASSGTPAPTRSRASTRSSKTPAARVAKAG